MPRFPVFAAASLALHAGLFVPALVTLGRAPAEALGGTATGTGGSAAVAGETFEVPELEPPADEVPATADVDPEPAPATPAVAPAVTSGDAPSAVEPVAPPASPRRGGRASHAPGPPPPAPLYGAVGDRAAGDLVTAFRRLFPIAVSGDPQWNAVPVGFYAGGDVTFVLAPDGTLTRASVSAAAAPAFRAAIERTFAALKHRVFTAKAETTRLHMVVRVTGELTNHGAFAIDARGSFELPSGRHVGVQITER